MAVAVSSVGASSPAFFVSLNNTMLILRFAGASGLSGSIGSLSAIPTIWAILSSPTPNSLRTLRLALALSVDKSQFVRSDPGAKGLASVCPEILILFGSFFIIYATFSSNFLVLSFISSLPNGNNATFS